MKSLDEAVGLWISVRMAESGFSPHDATAGAIHMRRIQLGQMLATWRSTQPYPLQPDHLVRRVSRSLLHADPPERWPRDSRHWRAFGSLRARCAPAGDLPLQFAIEALLFGEQGALDGGRSAPGPRNPEERAACTELVATLQQKDAVDGLRLVVVDQITEKYKWIVRSFEEFGRASPPLVTGPLAAPPGQRGPGAAITPPPAGRASAGPRPIQPAPASPQIPPQAPKAVVPPPARPPSPQAMPAVPLPARSPAPAAPPAPAGWTWNASDPNVPRALAPEWARSEDGFFRSLDGAEVRLAGACVRGRGHRQDGLYCDDSFALASAGEWSLLVVSDGAGSAKLSRFGSHIAVDAARRELEKALASTRLFEAGLSVSDLGALACARAMQVVRDGFATAFASAAAAIEDWVATQNALPPARCAERLALDAALRSNVRDASKHAARFTGLAAGEPVRIVPSDCQCTLLAAAIAFVPVRYPDGSSRRLAIAATCAIGDGMIALFSRSGSKAPPSIELMQPDSGQYSGEVLFLSAKSARAKQIAARLRIDVAGAASDVLALVAMTDGVADDYHESPSGMQRLYCDLVANGVLEPRVPPSAVSAEKARCVSLLAAASPPMTLASCPVREPILARPGSARAQQTVPVVYCDRVLPLVGASPRAAIDAPAVLAALAEARGVAGGQPGASLLDWLEAYQARGSYDDRTLAAVLPNFS